MAPDPQRRERVAARGIAGALGLVLAAAAVAAVVVLLMGVFGDDEVAPADVFEAATDPGSSDDPFAWSADRRAELELGATAGNSHVIYALSPGGVEASARRTLRFDEEIALAARRHGVSAEMMEAMVMLESAGRPEVIAGGTDPAAASGLGQIVASTGIDLLDMDIDLDRSTQLTATIAANEARSVELAEQSAKLDAKAQKAKSPKKAEKLERRSAEARFDSRDLLTKADIARRERAEVDPRFDPEEALDGMARYLAIATEEFGREDLAVTSYHMGIGNLQTVLGEFTGGEDPGEDLSYTEVFTDSSPLSHEQAWKVLDGFSDDSKTYYWRVLAAREILRLYRDEPEELERLARLHSNKSTAEEVFHPPGDTRVFDDAGELQDGLDAGELAPFPPRSESRGYGFVAGPQLGELTEQLGVDRDLYLALRPEALAALIYMSGRVQAIHGKDGQQLTVTSAVRDQAYQDALVGRNPEATSEYSLHTTGWAFDVLRDYDSKKQARAFQFVLDRLKQLGVIDYAVEPQAIHVTVSPAAEALLD